MSERQTPSSSTPATTPRQARPRFDYGGGGTPVPAAVAKHDGSSGAALAGGLGGIAQGMEPSVLLALLACAAAFGVLFAFNFAALESVWYRDPSWSHGYGIPVLAVILVMLHWDRLKGMAIEPSRMGLVILAYGVGSQVLFRVTGQSYLSNMSVVVVLYGVTLFIFGWNVMRVMWLPIGYLTLMVNLPASLYAKITSPLQIIAAQVGVALLPVLGISADREGTVIKVMTSAGIRKLEVEQACSGIRMLIAFVALAVVLAYSTPRPAWQKVVLTLSSVPVAILCNSFRVTLTGWLYVHAPQYAEGAPHAYLGLLMLIPAMAMQMGIGWTLVRIFIESPESPAGAAGGAT